MCYDSLISSLNFYVSISKFVIEGGRLYIIINDSFLIKSAVIRDVIAFVDSHSDLTFFISKNYNTGNLYICVCNSKE